MKQKKIFLFSESSLARDSDGSARFLHSVFTDPFVLSGVQWHLGYIGSLYFSPIQSVSARAGIERIWQDYQGEGVAVGIWDDGVEKNHWDLNVNYDAAKQVTVNGTLNNGQPLTVDDGHGTSVAGLIAADDNGLGGVGIAPDAHVTAVRVFGGADDINQNWTRYLQTLDSLGLFDVTNHSYGGYPDFFKGSDVAKFEAASVSGRAGLGTVNVKSAGNDNVDSNGDALDASRFTVTVAALSNTQSANVESYSSYGAHVLVSAPAASVTTDLLGTGAGYDGLLSGDYTNGFGGTSAAGPVTAGVVLLMLSANPILGWRDVQNILAYSAIGVGSSYSSETTAENFAWKWNGAANWNGGGLHFSEDYGYGMVNAFNAVRMAEVWGILYPTAAVSANEAVVSTDSLTVNKKISDLSTLNYQFNVSSNISLEHVALTVSLTHTDFTDLRIRLISPDGTALKLYDGSTGDNRTSDGTFTYTFGAEGFRGEGSAGLWTLQVQDAVRRDIGTLKSVVFAGYGSAASTNNVYHYTSEVVLAMTSSGGSNRVLLVDADGGTDWINAAAISVDLVLELEAGQSSTMGDYLLFTIASGTLIENAMGGDGNDKITGNDADNLIYGMRGDDFLWGSSGYDMAGFTGAFIDYQISAVDGVTTILGPDGTDVLIGFELLRFSDYEIDDPSSGVTPPDTTAPTLTSANPADNATGVLVSANLVLTFSEVVLAGTGSVGIYAASGLLHQALDVALLTFAGQSVTINPTDLAKDGAYYVLVDSGAFVDATGNAFVGVSSSTALNFNTESSVNVVSGTSKNDRLNGTAGSDLMAGLSGSDTLNGKLGADSLSGGVGKDYFVFDSTLGLDNIDSITDFNVRDDMIRVDNALFTNLSKTGTLNSKFFRANAGAVAQDSNDYILFDTDNGYLFYDSDGAGVRQALQFASLVGWVGTPTSSDFEVI